MFTISKLRMFFISSNPSYYYYGTYLCFDFSFFSHMCKWHWIVNCFLSVLPCAFGNKSRISLVIFLYLTKPYLFFLTYPFSYIFVQIICIQRLSVNNSKNITSIVINYVYIMKILLYNINRLCINTIYIM